jgi:phospholipid transport system substrate-binding protein
VLKHGTWKVYDLSVEGVSLLQSFRTQFGQILKMTDMDALIMQLNKQNNAERQAA